MKHLAALLLGILLGLSLWSHAGCGPSQRPSWVPLPAETAQVSTEVAPIPPPEPTYGRIVSGYYAAHPELARSADISEPLAPPGEWVEEPWGWLWLPHFVSSDRRALIEAELTSTLAAWEPDRGAVWPEPGPAKGTRVILCGPGLMTLSPPAPGLVDPEVAWGYYGQGIWLDGSDVIWVGLSFADLRTCAKAAGIMPALQRWAPGFAVELARQRTGWLEREHPR